VEALGYRGELLRRSYEFPDWFEGNNEVRVTPAAAFGRTPQSYDSACFAVLLSNARSGAELVAKFRALGAPIAFEVREDSVVCWRVAREIGQMREEMRISPDALVQVFREHASEWAAKDVLRLKNIRFEQGPRQGEFDLGLITALEKQIQGRLGLLLQDVLAEAEAAYRRNRSQPANAKELFRLIFRFLAAKVLHDRGHTPFSSLPDFSDADGVLRMVGSYYGETNLPLPDDLSTRSLVGNGLWSRVDFRNLSVEVLAYIYENTLVDRDTRQMLGTHSTPHNIARYIVHHLPFEEIGEDAPLVIEPFSGHGIFLVAALQRLRESLPKDMNERERHSYFVNRLRGYEIDSFALEVSKLCLMLADFPNHNGWQLHNEDLFQSKQFSRDLRRAAVVLCNPPFEDFGLDERSTYKHLRSPLKPVEFMHRVLDELPASGMLGLVLPRPLLDGKSYKQIRDRLVQRYEDIETVGLPDRVFHISQQTSALLIAKAPRRQYRPLVSVAYTHVADKDRNRFLSEYGFTRRDSELKNLEAASDSLKVVALREVWSQLERNPKLGTVAAIHRGVEWSQPFDEQKYIAAGAKPGFEPGFHRVEGIQCFQSPPFTFLCTKPEYWRKRALGAWKLPWQRPKVLFNVCRISRGQWCLAAFEEQRGFLASENFGALWPNNHWTPTTFAAVLNGPIANAFVASRESEQQRIRLAALRDIPIPELETGEIQTIDSLVDKYVLLTRPSRSAHADPYQLPSRSSGFLSAKDLPLFGSDDSLARAREVLLEIDATILKAYRLPPRMERDVLDFFRNATTDRSVPFAFSEYFPESFIPTIPLWRYISPNFKNCSKDFLLKHAPIVDDPVVVEALREVE